MLNEELILTQGSHEVKKEVIETKGGHEVRKEVMSTRWKSWRQEG